MNQLGCVRNDHSEGVKINGTLALTIAILKFHFFLVMKFQNIYTSKTN